MTDQPYYQLPPAQRRRLVFWAVLRGVLTAAALVVLYYVLPLDQPWNADTAVRILVGLLVFAGIAVWQVRSIVGSRYPSIRAFEALGLILPFYLLVFASTYFVMQRASAANFTQPLTRTDALYFGVTVFSTVGFGDITPKSEAARVVLIVQMLGDIALLAPACGSCWGPCAAASNDRARATRTARRLHEGRQDRAGRPADLRTPQGAPCRSPVLLRLVTVTAAWAASRTPARWPRPGGSSPRRRSGPAATAERPRSRFLARSSGTS